MAAGDDVRGELAVDGRAVARGRAAGWVLGSEKKAWGGVMMGCASGVELAGLIEGVFGTDRLPGAVVVRHAFGPFEVGAVAHLNAGRDGYACRGFVLLPGAVRCWLECGQVEEG